MNEHANVITQVLDYLYARIANPKASDAERWRIAKKAVKALAGGEEEPQKPEEKTDEPLTLEQWIAQNTIPAVQAIAENAADYEITIDDILEAEKVGKNRVKLVRWLEERLEGGTE